MLGTKGSTVFNHPTLRGFFNEVKQLNFGVINPDILYIFKYHPLIF